jgi:SPP1 family predicted phage head-tail adaptor
MRAGQLRDRITIQSRTRVSDGQGGADATPATVVANEPAQVLPIGALASAGREGVQASAMTAVLTDIVRLRYRSDVSVTDRVVFGSRTLEVQSVQDPDGRQRELQLLCSEVQQ